MLTTSDEDLVVWQSPGVNSAIFFLSFISMTSDGDGLVLGFSLVFVELVWSCSRII